jgi:large conductance mechanosensitive channel
MTRAEMRAFVEVDGSQTHVSRQEEGTMKGKGLWAEFMAFVQRGSVLDLAVGIIIGTAFGGVIKSLVDDVIMPPIGLLVGRLDFSNLFWVLQEGSKSPGPYASVDAAKTAGAVALRYGLFVNTIINFLIVALVIFFLIKLINQVMPKKEPEIGRASCRERVFGFV